MKKICLRLTVSCSLLLFTLLLGACGGTVTPPTTTNPWEQGTPTEETSEGTPTQQGTQASSIITNIKTVSELGEDSSSDVVSDTFTEGDTVYVTFDLSLEHVTPQDGYYGNVLFVFTNDGEPYSEDTYNNMIPEERQLTEAFVYPDHLNISAYYYHPDYEVAEEATVELYWCPTNDCSTPELAQTAHFTVKSATNV